MNKLSLKLLALHGFAAASLVLPRSGAKAEVPEAVAAPDESVVTIVHAEGAQIYECKTDARGNDIWQFREPIATLLIDDRTVGRHYAGPSWELADGSAVTGKIVGRAPGATPNDIPLLKLEVTSRREVGQLSAVTVVQRLNTNGGALEGSCHSPGVLVSVPYAADYAFLQKAL
jgi:hypothetical protein